ncbi:protein, rhodopirellula transposase family, partial [mine drainage metagenome]
MDPGGLREKLASLDGILDERRRRLVFAAEARALGRGGIELVHEATGMARSTLARGIRELAQPPVLSTSRVRRAGGGRKQLVEKDPALLSDLEALVEPGT